MRPIRNIWGSNLKNEWYPGSLGLLMVIDVNKHKRYIGLVLVAQRNGSNIMKNRNREEVFTITSTWFIKVILYRMVYMKCEINHPT